MIGMVKRPKLSVEISPTVKALAAMQALGEVVRPEAELAWRRAITLSRVSWRRLPLLLSAFDTVPTLTSASARHVADGRPARGRARGSPRGRRGRVASSFVHRASLISPRR